MAEMDEEPMRTSVDIPPKLGPSRRRVLYRVPMHLRENKKHIYEPAVVSLGPYHHGKPQLQLAEQLKNEIRDILCSSANHKDFLLSMISVWLDEIRYFYCGAVDYDDQELAEMMLRDACFVLRKPENRDIILSRLGMSGMMFMLRDMYMLENQIPLWLINWLIPFIYQGEDAKSWLRDHLDGTILGVRREWMQEVLLRNGEEEESLHLLEAYHRVYLRYVQTEDSIDLIFYHSQPSKEISISLRGMLSSPSRSVTDLRAKGVHFCPSPGWRIIKFSSSAFYAQLQLPSFDVSFLSIVFFSNLIAFEMSPETETDYSMTSYVNFMKTLIDKANDVKVLREKRILYSDMANDEDVVRMFKSIDTYGVCDVYLFDKVKMRIEEHCNSKAKTWMADLINTKFRSPWTAIALTAATFLLCLTFLQTYYTINPRK